MYHSTIESIHPSNETPSEPKSHLLYCFLTTSTWTNWDSVQATARQLITVPVMKQMGHTVWATLTRSWSRHKSKHKYLITPSFLCSFLLCCRHLVIGAVLWRCGHSGAGEGLVPHHVCGGWHMSPNWKQMLWKCRGYVQEPRHNGMYPGEKSLHRADLVEYC